MVSGSSDWKDASSVSLEPDFEGRRTLCDDCQGGEWCRSGRSLTGAFFPPNQDLQLPFLLGVRGRPSSSGVRRVVEPLEEEEEEFARSLATRGGRDGGSTEERCFLEREGKTLIFFWTRRVRGLSSADEGASDLSVRLEEATRTEASLRIWWW
jgi:hypothetical protein